MNAPRTRLTLDLGCSRAHWLALPALSRVDCKRLAALCRLSPADLTAPYEAGAPAKLGYCYRRLILNPLDVTAPYWGASWLAGERWCGKHSQRSEYTCPSALPDPAT